MLYELINCFCGSTSDTVPADRLLFSDDGKKNKKMAALFLEKILFSVVGKGKDNILVHHSTCLFPLASKKTFHTASWGRRVSLTFLCTHLHAENIPLRINSNQVNCSQLACKQKRCSRLSFPAANHHWSAEKSPRLILSMPGTASPCHWRPWAWQLSRDVKKLQRTTASRVT